MTTEVLVAGAGPVGLAMAAELARYGVSVRIVEKAGQRTDKSKALVVWSRTLELMDRMGCTPAFLATGRKATAANMFAGSKRLAHIELGGVDTPYPFALMIPQSETERLLEQYLNSLGVQVERTVELLRFAASESGVTSTLRHSDGTEETVEASWLIGCDGAHSTVRHGLGLGFEGTTMTSDWILADVHLDDMPAASDVNVFWHADGVLAVFPISETRFRVIADGGESKGSQPPPDPTMEQVQQLLDDRGPGRVRATDPVWLAGFRINERKVKDYRVGRVFLAGDAAHIHSPAGGQGMNTGIQDACNLAWKLALVCHGTCAPEPLLESYSIERSAVGEEVLKGAGRITTIAIMRGQVKQAIRNHIAALVFGWKPVRDGMAEMMTEISIGYPDNPLNGPGNSEYETPRAGERAPIRAGEMPFGSGERPRFALCTGLDAGAVQLLAKFPMLLEDEIHRPYSDDGLWLIRPDGYVALATRHGEEKLVESYLERLSGG
jgi:2-polyprenyl-6-methoxyphenol hydroxylase-like FAD-dependent oxidoreductase